MLGPPQQLKLVLFASPDTCLRNSLNTNHCHTLEQSPSKAEHAAGLLATGQRPSPGSCSGPGPPAPSMPCGSARTTRPTMLHGPAPLPRRPRRAAARPLPAARSLAGCAGRAPCGRASAEAPEARSPGLRCSRAAAAPSPRSTTMAPTPSFGEGLPASGSGLGTGGLGWSRGPSRPGSVGGAAHRGSEAGKPVEHPPPAPVVVCV